MKLILVLQNRTPDLPEALLISSGESKRLGRGEGNELRVDHPTLARRHARLDFSGERCTVAIVPDPSPAAAGIYVNKTVVRAEPRPIEDGDEVLVGGLQLKASYQP